MCLNMQESNVNQFNKPDTLNKMNKVKVLVVEDDPISQKVVRLLLEKQGYQADIAKNGNTAITLFQQNNYQLIFMDMGLPDIKGTEVTQQIRCIEQKLDKKPVPIIALTAHGHFVKAECMAAGMNDFISKPLSIDELNKLIEKWINPGVKTC